MSSALKNVFSTMKQTGLVKRIDTYLLTRKNEDNEDRKNETNSPSGALGCSRANYYQRIGAPKDPTNPRSQRIFDNGHGVHDRLQTYLEKMGELIMREVPLIHEFDEIQGHTDGLLDQRGNLVEVKVLEIKSINGRGFSSLKAAKEEHIAQASIYLYCVEEQRKALKVDYPTYEEFKASEFYRRVKYAQRYIHLKEGNRYTREEKIRHKVRQHIQLDNILYKLVRPINKVVFLYECKDTQDLKEYEIERDEAILAAALEKYRDNNEYFAAKKMPPRECKNKADGKWCSYLSTCFE
jgi:hypothetical protein